MTINLYSGGTDGRGEQCFIMKVSPTTLAVNVGTVYFSVRTGSSYDSGDGSIIESGSGSVVHIEKACMQHTYALALNLEPDTQYYWGAVCNDGGGRGSVVTGSVRTKARLNPIGTIPPK